MATAPPNERRWATTREAAEYLGVSGRTIRQMVSDGRLRDHRSGGRVFRLDLDELDALRKAVREYATLNEAMVANDALAEARIRYKLLAEAFEQKPQLRSQLNTQLERAKAEILRLTALSGDAAPAAADSGKVVAFDAARFRKSG